MSYKTGQYLTFALDVQLNDNEDWIAEGTVVEIYNTPRDSKGFTPVIITHGYTHSGEPITLDPYYEFFSNSSFKELA